MAQKPGKETKKVLFYSLDFLPDSTTLCMLETACLFLTQLPPLHFFESHCFFQEEQNLSVDIGL